MTSQTMDVFLDIEPPLTVRLGSAQMTFGEVMGLNAGVLMEAVDGHRADTGAGARWGRESAGGPYAD